MKKFKFALVAAVVIGLSGCALPVEMKAEQGEALTALTTYHKAQRTEYRATEAAKLAKGVAVAAEARKALAQVETQKAKAMLDKSLNK